MKILVCRSSTTLTFTPHPTNPSVLYESSPEPVVPPPAAVLASRIAAEMNAERARTSRAG